MKKGIDISRHQGKINWCETSKDPQCEFVIAKIGGSDGGLYCDSQFINNYMGCKGHHIPIGTYFYMGCDCNTAEKGKNLASNILTMLRGYRFEYPVYLDVEETNICERDGVTDAVYTICDILERAGYYVGIYGSDVSTFRDRVNKDALTRFDKWVARYPLTSNCTVITSCGMRQYSSSGSVQGIQGKVDLDVSYYDFPTIIKNKHLNGY